MFNSRKVGNRTNFATEICSTLLQKEVQMQLYSEIKMSIIYLLSFVSLFTVTFLFLMSVITLALIWIKFYDWWLYSKFSYQILLKALDSNFLTQILNSGFELSYRLVIVVILQAKNNKMVPAIFWCELWENIYLILKRSHLTSWHRTTAITRFQSYKWRRASEYSGGKKRIHWDILALMREESIIFYVCSLMNHLKPSKFISIQVFG